MKIGLTYDLQSEYIAEGWTKEEAAEFDKEETIEGLENALLKLGFEIERIGNFKSLISKIANNKWDLVFNIAEGCYGISRESQVPAILEGFKIPYTFSDPVTISVCHHKGLTKKILSFSKIKTSPFFIVEGIDDIDFVNLNYPLFIKPVAEGTGKGISSNSVVKNKDELFERIKILLNLYNQPILVEEFLPGREFTVGVIGTGKEARVIGVLEIIFNDNNSNIYSYEVKANYEKFVNYIIPKDSIVEKCKKMALEIHKILNCRDLSRIDIRIDKDGEPNFIEINPLPGLNPIHSDLPILSRLYGISYEELIERIVNSAISRYK